MNRYLLAIEYDGTGFCGWQKQLDQLSIQGLIEKSALAFCSHDVNVYGAGRTDAGVHAFGQKAHVDLAKNWQNNTVRDALNYHLKLLERGSQVSITCAEKVDDTFHARFSAVRRRYIYRIFTRRSRSALHKYYSWHIPHCLNIEAMNSAASYLIGTHDFTTFRDASCQAKSPIKSIDAIKVETNAENINFIDIEIIAKSFLHRQVRSIVGSLAQVGMSRWLPIEIAEALNSKNRSKCGPVAPAHGLYLAEVSY